MIPGAKCESCVFWSPPQARFAGRSYGFEGDGNRGRESEKDWASRTLGQCRRNPPQVVRTDAGLRGLWLLTLPQSWCGEHATVESGGAA